MGSYTNKYIKLYSAEMISIFLGIVSLFVVIPYVSHNKEIYGVYSLCLSTLVFLSYADLGFLSTSIKFAAEYFQLNDRKREIEVLSFGAFILFVVSCFISLLYIVLAINPSIVIKGIENSDYLSTARSLFGWMSFFSFFTAFNRLVPCIFSIRVESYVPQAVNIIGSSLKILSVFYFFSNGRYDIISYFIFIHTVPIICNIINLLIARKRYKYDILFLLKHFRWNSVCYNKTKNLAKSGLLMTISWILYYEIDQMFIARIYGANEVAIYAVGFAILNYIRMFLGGLFSPFNARFAHFRANGNLGGLSSFFINIVYITFPIVVYSVVTLCLFSNEFVIAWSGVKYIDSVPLVIVFVLLNLFAFLSYPTGSIITVFEKTKLLNAMAILLPIIYWVGILILPSSWGVMKFGFMKVLVFWLLVPIYSYITFKILNVNWKTLWKDILKYNIIPLIVVISLSLCLRNYIVINDKNIMSLIYVCVVIFLITSIGYLLSIFCNPFIKDYLKKLLIK